MGGARLCVCHKLICPCSCLYILYQAGWAGRAGICHSSGLSGDAVRHDLGGGAFGGNLHALYLAGLALTVVAGMFVLFMREIYPTEVVAITKVAVLLITDILPYETALTVLANPAPWTIASMFIVMGLWCAGAGFRSLRPIPNGRKNQPGVGDQLVDWLCYAGLCVCFKHACGGCDDPCVCTIGTQFESGCL